MARTAKNITFLYSARTQFSNAGDALINRGLVKLAKSFGNLVAIRGSADPRYLSEIGLEEDDLIGGGEAELLINGLISRFRGNRVILLETPGDVGGSAGPSVWLRSALAPALWLTGIRSVRVGASLGHSTPLRIRLMAWQSRFALCVGLRDPISRDVANRSGFKNVAAYPDLAFAVPAERSARPSSDGLVASLCFRSDKLDQAGQSRLVETIANALAPLKVTRTIIFVQVTRDQGFAERLAQALPGPVEIFTSLSINDLLEHYRQADFLLTNRLHGYLMAGLSGALPIALIEREKNRKIVGLLQDIGLEQLACEASSIPNIGALVAARAHWVSQFSDAADAQREKLPVLFQRALSPQQ